MTLESFNLLKFGKTAFIIFSVIVTLVIPLSGALVKGVRDGDWKPLGERTGGTILASDISAKEGIVEITDRATMEKNPEKYNQDYVDYKKSKILFDFVVLIGWTILFYWLFMKIVGIAGDNLLVKILAVFVALFFVAFIEEVYLLATRGINGLEIPLQSLYYLVKNWSFIISTGL